MNLREWLDKNKLTVSELCRRIGYTRVHLYAYLHGKGNISQKTAQAIFYETMGDCKVSELLRHNPLDTKPIRTIDIDD